MDDATSALPTVYIHAMESNDGQCTRVFAAANDKVIMCALFDVPKNPIPGWSPCCVYTWLCLASSNTDVLTYVNLNDLAKLYFRHSGTVGTFYCAGVGQYDACAGQHILSPNDCDQEWNADAIVLFSATSTREGMWGELYDLYWGSIGLGSTNAFQDIGYTKWVQIGNMITPWTGVLMRNG
jgi:hypothetical protein